ncbi:MAG: hypothetical protein R3218_03065 [Christiangramia sp.]|nr:hypothetical protein [Christiangramia sp.]
MDKEYTRILFGIESKRLQFKSNSGRLAEAKFKIHFPNKFKFLNATYTSERKIEINFRGIDGSTLEENLANSTKEEFEQIPVDLSKVTNIPKLIRVEFFLTEVDNPSQESFLPDTVGGGILVGTGG